MPKRSRNRHRTPARGLAPSSFSHGEAGALRLADVLANLLRQATRQNAQSFASALEGRRLLTKAAFKEQLDAALKVARWKWIRSSARFDTQGCSRPPRAPPRSRFLHARHAYLRAYLRAYPSHDRQSCARVCSHVCAG